MFFHDPDTNAEPYMLHGTGPKAAWDQLARSPVRTQERHTGRSRQAIGGALLRLGAIVSGDREAAHTWLQEHRVSSAGQEP